MQDSEISTFIACPLLGLTPFRENKSMNTSFLYRPLSYLCRFLPRRRLSRVVVVGLCLQLCFIPELLCGADKHFSVHGLDKENALPRLLPARTVAIEFIKYQSSNVFHYRAIIHDPQHSSTKGITPVELGQSKPIDDAIRAWYKQLSAHAVNQPFEEPDNQKRQGLGSLLSGLLWKKLVPFLRPGDTIIMVPDGDLHFVPWCALPSAKSGGFLLEDFSIALAPSVSRIQRTLSHSEVSMKGALLVGGIDYGAPDSPHKPLPETYEEVLSISRLAGAPAKMMLLAGKEATKQAVIQNLPSYRYVHLATHANYQLDQAPWFSSNVFFAAANPIVAKTNALRSKCSLTPGELMAGVNAFQGVEMVVLSAGGTSLGEVVPGEGSISLPSAFHKNGVRTVVGSLWDVDRNVNKVIMIEMYRNLWTNKLSKLRALQNAQLSFIYGYDRWTGQISERRTRVANPPQTWASFVLSGDWR
jgi:CHAT domain-containing protein